MLKFINKHLFWLLNLVTWLFICLVNFESGLREKKDTWTLIYSSILLVLSGFVITSVLRWLLIKFNLRNNFNIKKIAAILLAMSFALVVGIVMISCLTILEKNYFPAEVTNDKKLQDILVVFLLSYFLLGFWIVIYLSLKHLQKLNNERRNRLALIGEVKQAQLNMLRGNINPKFVVASIKSINELTYHNVSKSRIYITELSELLRFSLTKNNVAAIALTEEIIMLKNYVQLACLNDNSLEVTFKMDGEFDAVAIPPMLLINTFQLALSGSINKKQQWVVSVKQVDSSLSFEIKGVFLVEKLSKFNTQQITRRIQLLYKNEGNISSTSDAIHLRIPIILNRIL